MDASIKVLSKNDVEKSLESVLEDENIKNPTMEIEAGTAKGDGYMSFITKVDVTSDEKDLHLMIKVAPKSKEARKMMPIRDIFLREMFFYDTIVKEFNEFQKQKGVTEILFNVPKCFKTIKEEENEMLVMDNIKLKGYRMWNRKIQMNEDHVNLVLKQYARFHAISFAIKDQNPNLFESLTKDLDLIFTSERMSQDIYDKFLSNSRNTLSIFKPETDKLICQSIEKYLEELKDFFVFIENATSKHSTIIHGDCWCNNMMFKYENDADLTKPSSMCFLDFQISRLASPLLDISYFFHVSASEKILTNYKHHLKIYYEELKETYLKLGGHPKNFWSFDDLLNEWKVYAKYGFTMGLFIFKIMMCDEEEIIDFGDINDNNQNLMDIFEKNMNGDDVIQNMVRALAQYMFDNNFF